jgi:predicted amidohydrolase
MPSLDETQENCNSVQKLAELLNSKTRTVCRPSNGFLNFIGVKSRSVDVEWSSREKELPLLSYRGSQTHNSGLVVRKSIQGEEHMSRFTFGSRSSNAIQVALTVSSFKRILFWIISLVFLATIGSQESLADSGTEGAIVSTQFALIQMNAELNALDKNVNAIDDLVEQALRHGARVVVTPELATTGYSITAADVKGGEGLHEPFTKLQRLQNLAVQYSAYVYVGIAEVDASDRLRNSVVVFGPQGLAAVQQKRGLATWNERGDLPISILKTPYGDLATVICSDTYLPDWTRVATLSGADVIVEPANWWGDYGQLEIWRERAKENGVWILVANRWGQEIDRRFGNPITYDMNDAPSAVIDPGGKVLLSHRAKDMATPADEILYFSVSVPAGNRHAPNLTDTVHYRAPAAYVDLGLPCASVTGSSTCATGLPVAGKTNVAVLAYVPTRDPGTNLAALKQKLGNKQPDVAVLPALGISAEEIATDASLPVGQEPWKSLQRFVDDHGILALATTVRVRPGGREALVVFSKGKVPNTYSAIHDDSKGSGSHLKPEMIDLPSARLGIVTGRDFEFPEIQTEMALDGVDIVVVSSDLGGQSSSWDRASLENAWKVATNSGYHLAGSDSSGVGLLVQNGGMFIVQAVDVNEGEPAKVLSLDSGPDRNRKLNVYYPFDTSVLLSPSVP